MKTLKIIIVIILLALGGFFLFFGKSEEKNNSGFQSKLPPQSGLPDKVEAKRQAIYRAVLSSGYNKLSREMGTPFSYSFGGPMENASAQAGFAAYLKLAEETEGRSAFDIIPLLLKSDYGKQGDIYTWPSVHLKNATEWTETDIEQMQKIITEKEIEMYREFGSYAYYRLGIREDGTWIYYIAGD